MFNLDTWQEIWATISKNKLRTLLTAFSVSWGIFLLIFMIGSGTGFKNGVEYEFRDDAANTLYINSGSTTIASDGLQKGRRIQFKNSDISSLLTDVSGIESYSGRVFLGSKTVKYGKEKYAYRLMGVHPGHKDIEYTIMIQGRFINEFDIKQNRKICLVGDEVAKSLFGSIEEASGKWVNIAGIAFQVVGVFRDEGDEGQSSVIYIPISTAQLAYGRSNNVNQILVTMATQDVGVSLGIEGDSKSLLQQRHTVNPNDPEAIRTFNLLQEFKQIMGLISAINLALWIVGIFTIVAGIVGVGNIMLIVVKERTREIGIRKALGATPFSIVSLFLQESILITFIAGYLGLITGLGLIEGIQFLLMENGGGVQFFRNPNVNVNAAITATVLLAVSGAIAGFFPALKAAKLPPIEALRDE